MKIEISENERILLVNLIARYYQEIHREGWEIKISGDPKNYLQSVRRDLSLAESVLNKLDSSVREAMKPVKGDRTIEEI